jgi:hypothetical protein
MSIQSRPGYHLRSRPISDLHVRADFTALSMVRFSVSPRQEITVHSASSGPSAAISVHNKLATVMKCWRSGLPYFFVFLVLLLTASPSFAQGVPIITADCKIAWQPNSEADLVGYRLYSGSGASPGIYGVPTSVLAPTTSTKCSSLNIKTNGQYYIAISAYDTTGNESLISYAVTFYLQLPIAPSVIVSVAKTGSGRGTVKSNPVGINCGAVCSHEFHSSTTVTLSAQAATGSVFTGWSGENCRGTGTCTVTATNLVMAGFDVKRRH